MTSVSSKRYKRVRLCKGVCVLWRQRLLLFCICALLLVCPTFPLRKMHRLKAWDQSLLLAVRRGLQRREREREEVEMGDSRVETISRLAQWRIDNFGPCSFKKSDPFKVGIWNWYNFLWLSSLCDHLWCILIVVCVVLVFETMGLCWFLGWIEFDLSVSWLESQALIYWEE